jgi:hypothetical protein
MDEDKTPAYLACAIILIVSGFTLLYINFIGKMSSTRRDKMLNPLLWGFEQNEDTEERNWYLRLSWYKLLAAGMMGVAMISTIVVKYFSMLVVLGGGLLGTVAWVGFLFYFWNNMLNSGTTLGISDDEAFSRKKQRDDAGGWAAKAKSKPRLDDMNPNNISISSKSQSQSQSVYQTKDKRLPVTIITGFLGAGMLCVFVVLYLFTL